MNRPSVPPRGFTLIELLVVITIIMILAGLTMSLFKYGNTKAASDRARAEISALELALESYKIENGDYPREDATDQMIYTQSVSISSGVVPSKAGSSILVLYKALSGDEDLDGKGGDKDNSNNNEKRRIYFEFKPSMLYPRVAAGTARTGSTKVQAVIDPFRNVYGYSTAGSMTSGTATTGTYYNPTFDLWSTADSDGTKGGSDDATQKTWIKNW